MNPPFGKILPLQYELGTHRREGVSVPCMLKQRSDELELPSSLRLPGTTREKKNDDRTVRFRRKITARVVLSRHHYTPQEMAACFYDDDESKGMTADAIRSIRAFTSRGGTNDGSGSSRPDQDAGDDRCLPCCRGIEAMLSPEAMAERRRSKEDAIDAVLDEQDRQQQNTQSGGDDVVDREEAMRRASIRATWATARRALKLAAEDEAFVRREMRRGRATSERKTAEGGDDVELLGVLERASKICEQGARGSEGRENRQDHTMMTPRQQSRARISRLLASKSA